MPIATTEQRHVDFHDQSLPYTLKRSSRRSIGFSISPNNGLTVNAPLRIPLQQIEQALLEKQAWIYKHLKRFEQIKQLPVNKGLFYLGQALVLKVTESSDKFLRYVGNCNEPSADDYLEIPSVLLQKNSLHDVAREWLMQRAHLVLAERMRLLLKQTGLGIHQFKLSNANTRWGSCSSNRIIRLNWRLICLSHELIDYVIAHELAHLKEMNHSPAFWAEVKRIYPHYKQAQAQLKQISLASLSH